MMQLADADVVCRRARRRRSLRRMESSVPSEPAAPPLPSETSRGIERFAYTSAMTSLTFSSFSPTVRSWWPPGSRAHGAGERPEYPIFVPQSSQNLGALSNSLPQPGHFGLAAGMAFMGAPHSGQNLTPASTSAPQPPHVAFGTSAAATGGTEFPARLGPASRTGAGRRAGQVQILGEIDLADAFALICSTVAATWAEASSIWTSGAQPLHRPRCAFQQFSGQTHLPHRLHWWNCERPPPPPPSAHRRGPCRRRRAGFRRRFPRPTRKRRQIRSRRPAADCPRSPAWTPESCSCSRCGTGRRRT